MKKLIALLLVLCTVLSLCACGSSGKKKDIDEITEDDLNAAVDQLMEAEEEETEAVETSKDIGPIEDYLVTVEITPENFNEYFEWTTVQALDEWGEPVTNKDDNGNVVQYTYLWYLKSKKYDEGLVIYNMEDWLVEFELWTDITVWNSGRYITKYDKAKSGTSSGLGLNGQFCMSNFVANPITSPDQYEMKIAHCKGTVTYIKDEYIVETTKEEVGKLDSDWGYPSLLYSYYLADGSTFSKRIYNGNEY